MAASDPCLIEGCPNPVGPKGARGRCTYHYQRYRRGVPAQRKCETCGVTVDRNSRFCSDVCKPRCLVDGCSGPVRKRGWCAAHYAQWVRTGNSPMPFQYKWSKRVSCLVCGEDSADHYREFCSGACRYRYFFYETEPPTVTRCVACGTDIDLTQRGIGGQRIHATIKFCRPCKRDYNKYKMSARELAARDGFDCGLCGEFVDMDLSRAASIMCASVDHIIPRSLGGTHEPENLQLAHLYCNQVKSDRCGSAAYLKGVIRDE